MSRAKQGPTGWLLTITDQDRLAQKEPGAKCPLWTDPQRDSATGEVRRRSNGEPSTPKWGPGDEVVVYFPITGACPAILELVGWPIFDDDRELFDVDAVVLGWVSPSPTLSDLGIAVAVQGGRQRLTAEQHISARRHLLQQA